jgi:transposase-like protein
MSRALSDDLRSRVLAASADGMSARSAAARFGIGISTAIAWIANARQGQLTAGKQGRRSGSRLDAHEAFMRSRPYVREVKVARPRSKLNAGVALDRPEPCPKLSEGEP